MVYDDYDIIPYRRRNIFNNALCMQFDYLGSIGENWVNEFASRYFLAFFLPTVEISCFWRGLTVQGFRWEVQLVLENCRDRRWMRSRQWLECSWWFDIVLRENRRWMVHRCDRMFRRWWKAEDQDWKIGTTTGSRTSQGAWRSTTSERPPFPQASSSLERCWVWIHILRLCKSW